MTIGALLACSVSAHAQTWTGAVSSDWNNGANWSGGTVPTAGSVVINTDTKPAVAHGIVVTLSNLHIGYTAGTTGSLTLEGGAQFTAATFSVGRGGTGSLSIIDSVATFTNSSSVIVIGGEGGTGYLTVSGSTARLTTAATMTIGGNSSQTPGGYGSVSVTNGAVVRAESYSVGNMNGGASVLVDGAGSEMISDYDMGAVGKLGDVDVKVRNGGKITLATHLYLGSAGTTGGYLELTGSGSRIDIGRDTYISYRGTAEAIVSDRAVMTVNRNLYLGFDSSGSSKLVVTSGASVTVAGLVTVGYASSDAATLIIARNATVTAPWVLVGRAVGSSGSINIGGTATGPTDAPGRLIATEVHFGDGQGTLNFNHTDLSGSYSFDPILSSETDAAIINHIAGVTRLTADSSAFLGETNIAGGKLQVEGTLGGRVNVLAGGTLAGTGTIGDTVNAGTIAPGASIGTLTIAGNYTGNNGTLLIEAVLGGDDSPTDRLVITGDVSGSTNVRVFNRGGLGAKVQNGISIIEIGGVSPAGAFTLQGDYVTENGQQAVIGGAYAYTLEHGSRAAPSDGNWYLVSEFDSIDPETGEEEEGPYEPQKPRYQPGIPLYEQYPQVLASLNTVPTLQQRVGNRYWSQQATGLPGNDGTMGAYGMWARVEGSRSAYRPALSKVWAGRDVDLWKLQTGFDAMLRETADGSMLVGGVNVSYGTALAEIGSPFGRGKIDTTGTGIGATLTWYDASGFYVDTQAQVLWFDSDITSTTLGRRLVKGNNGNGYVLSAETGKRHRIGNGLSVTPQVQLTWSRVKFDNFTDPFSANIASRDGDSLRARLGLSLDYEMGWIAADGTRSQSHLYGIVNLYNEFLNGTKVSVANVPFRSRDERLWAGVGLGGTYKWDNGRYALFGNVNLSGSLDHMGRNHNLGGSLGFRASW